MATSLEEVDKFLREFHQKMKIFDGPDLWEFGKVIKNKEVYIKITIGGSNKPVICISFHYPERKIKYPHR